MKAVYILFLIFCCQICKSQSLENYWEKFSCENWTLTIDKNKRTFLSKEIQYTMVFQSLKVSSKVVKYYVYNRNDIDTEFKKEAEKNLMSQSCFFESGKFNFNSFYLNDYYYFLAPCHCSTKRNEACENLAEKIENFVAEK